MQVLVLLAALLFGGGLALYLLQHRLNHQVGTRAVTVAESVAQGSVVRRTVASGLPGGPHSPLATLAERVRQATGATIVIIANTAGARYADAGPMAPHHPPTPPLALSATNAADSAGPATTKISTEPAVLVQGGTVWGQAPIFSDRSVLAGEVAIGFPSSSAASPSGVPSILIGMAAGLVLGALASTVLSRRLFRQLLGLEPDELAVLLHERETTLHAIQEGVICLDAAHRVRFANNEASRMLDLPLWYPAEPLDELVPASRLHDALLGRLGDAETLLVVNEQVLIAEHTPIFLRGRQVGAVITIRD
ncbi:MAG: hypothetical protein ACRDRL_28640, partial [Sciscionella sp.]